MNVTTSRFDDLLYVSVIPTSYISRQLDSYRLTSTLIILLSFAPGLYRKSHFAAPQST